MQQRSVQGIAPSSQQSSLNNVSCCQNTHHFFRLDCGNSGLQVEHLLVHIIYLLFKPRDGLKHLDGKHFSVHHVVVWSWNVTDTAKCTIHPLILIALSLNFFTLACLEFSKNLVAKGVGDWQPMPISHLCAVHMQLKTIIHNNIRTTRLTLSEQHSPLSTTVRCQVARWRLYRLSVRRHCVGVLATQSQYCSMQRR